MQDEFSNQIISSSGYFVNACVDMAGQCSHAAFLTGTSRLPVTEELLTFSDIAQQPTPPGPGESFAATVELVDIGGNKVESEELSIAIALDSSFGVSSGIRLTTSDSLSKTTQNGEAEWTGLTVNKAPVIYSFTFSTTKADGTHLEVKSERVSVVIGSQPGEIQFLSQPQDVL